MNMAVRSNMAATALVVVVVVVVVSCRSAEKRLRRMIGQHEGEYAELKQNSQTTRECVFSYTRMTLTLTP